MGAEYFIREGYRSRPDPEYASDAEHDGVAWQPDVYPAAGRWAELFGAGCIVDLGCGAGTKLAALHPRFEVIGLDLPGPNLQYCRERYPFGEWIEHDLESELNLPVPEGVLVRSVVVCSDVIEHLLRPERLLRKLRSTLDIVHAIVLSTPERELTWGVDHNGPPPNPCHVREWSSAELGAFLDDAGFHHRSMSLTRSNDRLNQKKTIMCGLFRDSAGVQKAAAVHDGVILPA